MNFEDIESLNPGFICHISFLDEEQQSYVLKRNIKSSKKFGIKNKIKTTNSLVLYECCLCQIEWKEPSPKHRIMPGREFQCINPKCDSDYINWINYEKWFELNKDKNDKTRKNDSR